MLANTFITLLSTISLASLVSAVPLKATSTENTIAKRQAGNPLDVTVIAYAQVSALGLQVSARCLQVQVAADAGLTAVQNAVSAAANVGLGVGQVANTQICASANNRVPVCVDATGCGLGACLPGFADDGSGNCLPIVISNNALDATVLASVDVNLGGVVGLTTQCLLVPVAADAGLTEIQNAVSAQAQADLGVTNIADVNLCLAVNNRIPTCDSVNGCSTGGCLPGFALDTTTNTCIAVIIPAPTPSARLRRRNIQRRTLCPSTKETACSLSGSSKLSNSAVVSHQYECHDLSSSIEACGACGNACTGAGEGCQDGECIKMD